MCLQPNDLATGPRTRARGRGFRHTQLSLRGPERFIGKIGPLGGRLAGTMEVV